MRRTAQRIAMVALGVLAALPWRYRGRRRVGRGELSTSQAAQVARDTREAELVDLVVAPLTREGRRYGSASAAYRYLRRLGREEG